MSQVVRLTVGMLRQEKEIDLYLARAALELNFS
jgi:hypothetical protein